MEESIMSTEEDRFYHSRRIQQKQNHIKHELDIAKAYGVKIDEPHKNAKKHVMTCGNPRCVMCGNPRKFFKEKTIKEKSFEQTESWNDEWK